MRFEEVSAEISKASTGVYIAYPTTTEMKSTYRGHTTQVNLEHTKIGIARRGFAARERQYLRTFQSEVVFFPILPLPVSALPAFEARLVGWLLRNYARSGRAREWFHTTERQVIAECVWAMHRGVQR